MIMSYSLNFVKSMRAWGIIFLYQQLEVKECLGVGDGKK